jgi:hypothetical protein
MTDCNREYLQKSQSSVILTDSQSLGAGAADPKSVQELTSFVQVTLQQMQDKFQSMSDQIIGRNILFKIKFKLKILPSFVSSRPILSTQTDPSLSLIHMCFLLIIDLNSAFLFVLSFHLTTWARE